MFLKTLKDGLLFQAQAIKSGIRPTIYSINLLIHLYARSGLIHEAHCLFDEMPERNVFTWNTIIAAHIKNNDFTRAQALFNSCIDKDLVSYNSMLSGLVSKDGYEADAFKLFGEMRASVAAAGIDEFTVTTMLNLVAKLAVPSLGAELHCYMVKSGNTSSAFSMSSLIDMYSKCGCFREACQVFYGGRLELDLVSRNAMVAACCREGELELGLSIFWLEPELNDTVSWNTMISGLEQNGYHEESLNLFGRMVEHGVMLNEHTFASVLSACSGLRDVKLGKEVHARVLKEGLMITNQYIGSGIVDVYCKCGNMDYAESANATLGNNMEENQNQNQNQNPFSIASMIQGYSSLGNMERAQWLFDSLNDKNTVVWTTLFSGYVKSQHRGAVFVLLKELLLEQETRAVVVDAVILISVLGECAIQASLDPGKQIHTYLLRTGIEMDEKLTSAVIDMYSKCGNLVYAERIFRDVVSRDLVLYNMMIAGYARHGNKDAAVDLLREMLGRGVRPDAATFVGLLSACRHAGGSVELGEALFLSMETDCNVRPEMDHYACMIDLYGRANELEKAVLFMKKIPVEPDGVVWGALLNACKLNGNMELAREAEKNLLRAVEGDINGSRYVQLANSYAAQGNWVETARIRKTMKGKQAKKLIGCSWKMDHGQPNPLLGGYVRTYQGLAAMGGHVSKKTAETTSVLNLDSDGHYTTELTSYQEECQADADLQSFDSTLHARTNHVINTLAVGVEVRALSFNSLKEVTGCLLEMNQQVVKVILECKQDIWKNEELFDLVEEYFENSLQTLDFCTALEKCLKRVKDSQLILMVALQHFDDEEEEEEEEKEEDTASCESSSSSRRRRRRYARTLEDLKNFKAAGDPFTEDFFQIFQSIYKQQMSMLDRLQKRKSKLDKKLKKIGAWRKVSGIIFVATFAAVLICSVVAAAVAAPPVAAALAAATAIPLASVGKWIDSLWKNYEDALSGQMEVISTMQVGTYVTIKDLENIKVLIDRLEIEMGSLMHKADFAITEEAAVKSGIEEIKKKLSAFTKNVEDLGSEADTCSRDIRRARTVVLQRIIKHSNN
ncbi:hypothetical protein Dimus_002280 [Dionaea muscipula]